MRNVNKPNERLKFARERAGFGSAAEAARALDVPEVTYRAHESGTRSFDQLTAQRYAKAFGADWTWILVGPTASPRPMGVSSESASTVTQEPVPVPAQATMPKSVPVHGTVVGGSVGDFEFNGEVVDYVRRPPGIANTKGVFALYVSGDSMWPRFRPGSLIYLNPSRPPRPGDDVVIEMFGKDGGAGPAYIKTLKARTPLAWICEQFTPPLTLEYPAAQVRAVYRVMTLEELLGV